MRARSRLSLFALRLHLQNAARIEPPLPRTSRKSGVKEPKKDYGFPMSADGEVPLPLLVPRCECNSITEVIQSRHSTTASRAYYTCPNKGYGLWSSCKFFQWIDGPEIVDEKILLFSLDPYETVRYEAFERWLPRPPNPPPMTDEKAKASRRHIRNPPLYNCGRRVELERLPTGLTYTLVFLLS